MGAIRFDNRGTLANVVVIRRWALLLLNMQFLELRCLCIFFKKEASLFSLAYFIFNIVVYSSFDEEEIDNGLTQLVLKISTGTLVSNSIGVSIFFYCF